MFLVTICHCIPSTVWGNGFEKLLKIDEIFLCFREQKILQHLASPEQYNKVELITRKDLKFYV